MKKTYLNPELLVVKLKPVQMLITSMEIDGETDTFDARDGDFDED